NSEIDDRLRRVLEIPLEKIIPLYPQKFYDAKPPVVLMMEVLWTDVFNQIPDEEAFMEAGRKALKIRVELSNLTKKLREQFCFQNIDSRQPENPKTEWVKEAMDTFVEIGYATKIKNTNDSYWVKYTHRKDVLEFFAKKTSMTNRKQGKSDNKDQLLLF
ncbi:MAG TPA: hypothetical protein VGA99_07935, partial [bacterium]